MYLVFIFYTFVFMRQPENEHLVKQLKKGDVSSFNLIFKNYNQKVYNFCLQLLKNKNEAEEITQEVFIALWQNRDKIDTKSSIVAYILAIARNQIYKVFRKSLYKQAYIENLINSQSKMDFITEDQVMYNELNSFLNISIEKLPPKRREVFILSRMEGLTYKEIAQKLNIAENTVDVQIRKALDFIKDSFKNNY